MSFPRATLALLDRAREVDIETHSAKGVTHGVPIWIVVDGDDVFVRTYRGKTSRWYRELLARPGAILADGKRVPVRAERAVDADALRRTSDGYRKKYPKSGSLDSMLRNSAFSASSALVVFATSPAWRSRSAAASRRRRYQSRCCLSCSSEWYSW